MSGGHWNYRQDALRQFGEELYGEESDPVLVACGQHLVTISDILDDFDRIISGDDGHEGWEEAQHRLTDAIGAKVVVDTAADRLGDEIKNAMEVLKRLRS